MSRAKRLIFSSLALLALAGIGWGTYSLTGPSSTALAEAEHAGHAHEESDQKAAEKSADRHGHDEDAHHDEHAAADDDQDAEHAEAASAAQEESGHAHDAHAAEAGELCPEHNVAEAEDALCNSARIPVLRPGEGLKVRLATADVGARIGVVATRPVPAGEAGAIWAGQVVFNRDRLAHVAALAAGSIRSVRVKLGDRVPKGAVLAEIAAPEAASLRGELAAAASRRALAEAVYLREKDLFEKGITSRHEYQQAEAEFHQAESAAARARQQVDVYGLAAGGASLAVRAPFSGIIVDQTAVLGEAVAAGTALFTVADLSTLWMDISAPEAALPEMQAGRTVTALFPALPGRAFAGKIFWVAPALDEKTRMLKALAAIDNRDGLLRSGLYGEIRPTAPAVTAAALAVPAGAVQSVDGQPFVFVRLADDLFELRRVTSGRREGGLVIIAAGLDQHDQVVTAQAFALKSEVLRARLGASCADH